MFDPQNIEEAEARLKAAGKTSADLCREANIAQTTWWRWKTGAFFPSFRKSREIGEVLDRLAPAQNGATE